MSGFFSPQVNKVPDTAYEMWLAQIEMYCKCKYTPDFEDLLYIYKIKIINEVLYMCI